LFRPFPSISAVAPISTQHAKHTRPPVHPRKRVVDLPRPIAPRHNGPLESADEVQCDALPDPQPDDAPAVEGEVYSQRQRAAVVADEVDGRADMLPSLAAERAAAGAIEPV
jgi:hypothetical protein